MVIKTRRVRWARHVACMLKMRNTYIIVDGKPEGKKHRRRPRSTWEDPVGI
jgi:hypothetical protein